MVTGAGGYVGRYLPFGIKVTRQELDITDVRAIRATLDEHDARGIVNLACLDVRRSEADRPAAFDTNVRGAYLLAGEAASRNIPIVQLSTACVFDGPAGTAFHEDDRPNPVNVYGLTKHLSELAVAARAPRHLIVRASWLYGATGSRRFLDSLPSRLHGDADVLANAVQTGSPTYLPDFFSALEAAIHQDLRGIVHLANAGAATALDIVRAVEAEAGATADIRTLHADEDGGGDGGGAVPRSASEALASDKMQLRPWREALTEFMAAGTIGSIG